MIGTYTIYDDVDNLEKMLVKTFGKDSDKSDENFAHVLKVLAITNNDAKQYNSKISNQFKNCVDNILTLVNTNQTDYLEDIVPKRLKSVLKELDNFKKVTKEA